MPRTGVVRFAFAAPLKRSAPRAPSVGDRAFGASELAPMALSAVLASLALGTQQPVRLEFYGEAL